VAFFYIVTMKIFKFLVVFFLIVVLPGGSWFFLQHGLDWRRVKAKQLVPKSELLKDIPWTEEEMQLVKNTFDRTTTFIINGSIEESEEVIIDQFKDAYTFKARTRNELPQQFLAKLDMTGVKYMLIDTAMIVRQIYKDNELSTINRLIEDLALITPQRKTKDIKMKTQTNE